MAQRTCTLCNSFVSINDIDTHYDVHHSNQTNQWPPLSGRYHNNMMQSDNDDEDSVPLQSTFSTDFEVFLHHTKTSKDIQSRRENNNSYPITWYGKPFRSSHFNNNYAIRTLWSDQNELYIESVAEIASLYPDFKSKILNSDFKHILSNNSTDWKEKALLIINCLLKEQSSKPFRRKVDEKRDSAPKYYETIKEPMDLSTLKQLLNENKILNATKFVTNLMLIWDNAKQYNQKSHKIYQFAVNLKKKCNQLIKQYWANNYKNLYESKRRSHRLKMRRNKYNNNIRNTNIGIMDGNNEYLLCCQCNNRLQFMCGFHHNCECINIFENDMNSNCDDDMSTSDMDEPMSLINNNNNMPKCNECDITINDTNICYYHCINGCNSENDSEFHCIFLCEICAQKYNKIAVRLNNNNMLGFYGCFIDLTMNGNELWIEVITMECDGNEIYYKMILSSETNKQHPITCAKIINKIGNEIQFEVDKNKNVTNFAKGLLSNNGLTLTLSSTECHKTADIIFNKTRVFCHKCGTETRFMLQNMFPSIDCINESIYCDTHDLYYEKQKLLNENERCVSFKYLNNNPCDDNNIYKQDFYFSCVKCNDFEQCAICTLIQSEIQFNRNNNNSNNSNEPSCKRQRINENGYIERNSNNNNKQEILLPVYQNDMSPLNAIVTPVKTCKIVAKKCKKRHRNQITYDNNSNNSNSNSNSNNSIDFHEYEQLKELYIKKNKELNTIKTINNDLNTQLEICQVDIQSLKRRYNNNNDNLNAQIVKLQNERDEYLKKYNELKQLVTNAHNYSCND